MKTTNSPKTPGFVGVDLGHKSWKACRYAADGAHCFKEGAMTKQGIASLAKWLSSDDIVAIETGTASFWFKRTLQNFLSVRVVLLNARELKHISDSLRKTDKEDALKLAQFVAKYNEHELHTVRAADEQSEKLRKLVSERRSIIRASVQCRSRFYALCIQAGFTTVRKRDFRTAKNMQAALPQLPERFQTFARRLFAQQELFEAQLVQIEAECEECLADHAEDVNILTSMPGVADSGRVVFGT